MGLLLFCASRSTPPPERSQTSLATAPPGREVPPSQPAHPDAEEGEPVVVVSSLATLRALEEQGFDLGSQLSGQTARTGRELSALDAYRVVTASIVSDLTNDRRQDPNAGVGMRYAHRQFDARWLSSASTRFELIAIANRTDRRVFAPEHCGEIRFVYRFAYSVDTRSGPVDSRLPMTLSVVRFQPRQAGSECQDAARAWLRPKSDMQESAWLTGPTGPLSSTRMQNLSVKSVELNLQSVRWPSTVRPNLGGHAEYVLRVFRPLDEPPFLAPEKLENTVDSSRLMKDVQARRELRDWLRQPAVLRALDAGVLVVPEKYLAERAVSVSPHGLKRLTNRPYTRLFSASDFSGLDFTGLTHVRSEQSLLRRLDGLSCQGCHQSRSLAGFHLLGEDAPDKAVDALRVPMSAHFHSEVWRRKGYLRALATGALPDETRPPAERAPDDAGVGAACGLGDPAYASWTCANGLRCVNTGDPEVGTCLLEHGPSVGDPCEYGLFTSGAAHRDAARLRRTPCDRGRVCEVNSVGFPSGMCAGSCEDLPDGAICGGIPLLVEFNACLAQGQSFERCVVENTRPGALRACSFHAPCRDDYVCARAGDQGACMPPYFLFQLRVDGHPI